MMFHKTISASNTSALLLHPRQESSDALLGETQLAANYLELIIPLIGGCSSKDYV